MVAEASIENYLVERVKARGGKTLKGATPGTRFIDRICIMPDGVTLWVECKRPRGRIRPLQQIVLGELLSMGHFAFLVQSKEDVDFILNGALVFYGGRLFVSRRDNDQMVSTPIGLVRP